MSSMTTTLRNQDHKGERYLIFVIHGIGEQIYKSPNLEDHIRNLHGRFDDLVPSKFGELKNVKIDFIPVEWHSGLHASERAAVLRTVTLPAVPVIRKFCNETSGDIMWYFCNGTYIVNSVVRLLNESYSSYVKNNPSFIKTNVSLIAHSLGGAITYDILNHIQRVPAGIHLTPKQQSKFPELCFAPQHLFIFGSPAGAVQVMSDHPFIFPKNINGNPIKLHNIFHPYDPVAYRIEPYVNPEFEKISPVLLPSALQSRIISFPSLGFNYSFPSIAFPFPHSFSNYLPSFQLQLPSALTNPLKRKLSDNPDETGAKDSSPVTTPTKSPRKRLRGKRSVHRKDTPPKKGSSPTPSQSGRKVAKEKFSTSQMGLNDTLAHHVRSAKEKLKKHLRPDSSSTRFSKDEPSTSRKSRLGINDHLAHHVKSAKEKIEMHWSPESSGRAASSIREEWGNVETSLNSTEIVARAVKDFQQSLQSTLGVMMQTSLPRMGGADAIAARIYATRAMLAESVSQFMKEKGREVVKDTVEDTGDADCIVIEDEEESHPPDKRRRVEDSCERKAALLKGKNLRIDTEGFIVPDSHRGSLLTPAAGPSSKASGMRRSASAPEVASLGSSEQSGEKHCATATYNGSGSRNSPSLEGDLVDAPKVSVDCPTERVDYVLREQLLEKGSEYLFSIATHGWYWGNRDVMNFMLSTLSKDMITVESEVTKISELDNSVMIVRNYSSYSKDVNRSSEVD